MRILTAGNMYPPHHLGGYELTWRSSVEHLRAAGHDLGVLTTDFGVPDPDPAFADDTGAVRELRWYWHDHDFPRLSPFQRIALERHNGRVLDRVLSDFEPDVVGWWAMGGMSLSLIDRVRRAGIPSVGMVGDDWMRYGPDVDGWLRMTRRLRAGGRLLGTLTGVPASVDLRDTTWLFNSEVIREGAAAGSLPLGRTEIAHPGVDAGVFTQAPEPEWRWSLLHVGRLDARKGIDTAIDALGLLPAEATLTVLGSGDDDYLAELRDRCAQSGLADRVAFEHRPRQQLPAAYAEADAVLFPVRWEEPWGLVPLEAMAVGTPVVATGTGGSAEYLRDRENAMVVGRHATAGDVAAAVRALAGDRELRSAVRGGGLATASRFTERGYNEAIERALMRAVA